MIVATIPYSRLDPGNSLAREYFTAPGGLTGLFPYDYTDPRALRPLVEAQGARERPALAELLVAYNREVGGSIENAARIDEGFCVVSGQQAGLLCGPAYTTYKIFTLLNAARVLEEELSVPVVPLFWVETEDHDWDEVNRFFWKGRRFRIESEVAAGTPVARIEVDPAPFLGAVQEVLGTEAAAWQLVRPERNVARWHVRSLARLLEGSGIVFVEPALLREPMRPLAQRIVGATEAIDESLGRDIGHDRTLSPPKGAYLFDSSSTRRRIERGATVPQKWSTDVVSRVLVQNAAFPVLAAVCGPSEVQYWAQLTAAHDALSIPMPAVLPRNAATLIEEGVARDAARLGLDLEAVVRGEAKPPEPGRQDAVAGKLRGLAEEARLLIESMDEGRLDLPPNSERPFRRTVTRLEEDLGKLAGRIDDSRAEAAGAGRRRYERVLRELRPRDGLQERSHSLFPYLVRHGAGLADRLRDSFDPFEIGHYLVQL
ncbi:MAG: bacillithiol biosynthesis protein BshC [Planctomycetota bacterium]|jgi:uncharacterized protein YllA (UPF0747 family)